MRRVSFVFCDFEYLLTACRTFASVIQRVWRSMRQSIHFSMYIRKHYVFVSPLLATRGAASVPQMRRVSFEFCDFEYLFTARRKCATVIQRVWRSMCKSTHSHEQMLCLFSTIGDDGSRQCPSDAASFVRVLRFRILIYGLSKICRLIFDSKYLETTPM